MVRDGVESLLKHACAQSKLSFAVTKKRRAMAVVGKATHPTDEVFVYFEERVSWPVGKVMVWLTSRKQTNK